MRAALRKRLRSLFFPLWEINPSWFLWIIAHRSRSVRGYPRLPTFEGHARTRMPMHDGDMHLRREITTFPRGAVVKGRTRVVIRGVARRDYDVSKVSVGPIKANRSNRQAVRASSAEPCAGMPTIHYRGIDTSIFSLFHVDVFDLIHFTDRIFVSRDKIVDYRKQF